MLYMLTAGKKALADGGISEEVMNELDKTRCGVMIGYGMGGMKVFNDAIEALRISYKRMNPFCVPFATTSMGSAMLTIDLGWMGPNYSISTTCATSNIFILNARNHIIRGEVDVMLRGGSDSVIIPLGGFVACRAFSKSKEDPTKALGILYLPMIFSLTQICINSFCTKYKIGRLVSHISDQASVSVFGYVSITCHSIRNFYLSNYHYPI